MRTDAQLETAESLQEEAGAFAQGLRSRADRATLVTLSGELGAGKTTFSQGAAAALGVEEHVTSPTFVLAKTYPLGEDAAFRTLLHIDAYRLEQGAGELAKLGFDAAYADPATLILLEWPEQVADALPQADIAVSLKVAPSGGRLISYMYADA